MPITNKHSDYRKLAPKWRYTWDHYEGTPILDSLDEASASERSQRRIRVVDGEGNERDAQSDRAKSSDYLHRHDQGESDDAYRERAKITDFSPLFAPAVDTLAGVFFENDSDIQRDWGSGGLGDPDQGGSIMSRLWKNIDGDGLNYETLWKQIVPRLIALHTHWVLVEGLPRDEDGKARGDGSVKLIHPLDVTNWREEGGRPVEVVVREYVDMRKSVLDEAPTQKQYVLYTLEGHQRWTPAKDEDGEYIPGPVIPYFDDGSQFVGVDGRPILPIFRGSLTLDRNVGYLAARKANAYFNLESSRDWLIWVANFIRFIFDQRETGMDAQEALEWLRRGWSTLPYGEHEYINPSGEPAELATKVLEAKKRDFFDSVFQQYNDAAQQKTATEIRIDQRDLRAFMVMLRDAVDEAENATLWRLAQVYFPADKTAWGQARAERSDEFEDYDIAELSERLAKRYFGGPVPTDKQTQLKVAKMILDLDGVPYEEEDLDEMYESGQLTADMAARLVNVLALMDVPPAVAANIKALILSAFGMEVNEDDVAALEEGAREEEIMRSQESAALREISDLEV